MCTACRICCAIRDACFLTIVAIGLMQVVLIGHSLAGLSCMLLMEQFPHKIGLVIHVAAVLAPNGVPLNESAVADLVLLQVYMIDSFFSQFNANHLLLTVR